VDDPSADIGGLDEESEDRGLPGFDQDALLDHYINANANIHTQDNKVAASTRSTTTC